MSVVSKTEASNAVSDYFVSALAGPKLGGQPVKKGDRVRLSEHQARALLAAGALVTEAEAVDDPFGEEAAAAKAAEAEAAHQAQAEAEAEAARKAAEAEAAREAARKAAADAGHGDDAHHDAAQG